MNLTSCPNCGVVLDKDFLEVPEIYDDKDCIIPGTAEWNGEDFIPLVKCPCCKHEFTLI